MLMRRYDGRALALVGFVLFIAGSLLAMPLSSDFSGPQFLSSSLMRALAQALMMAPLSAVTIAGIEHDNAPSASALFNMMRNLGGAVGIAVLQTFLTTREQFHSAMLSGYVNMASTAVTQRIDAMSRYLMARGISDADFARHEALVGVGRAIRRQAFFMGFSDTIVMQSIVLLAALGAVVLLKKTAVSAKVPLDAH
jgi:DHA2 family multidrug resistance protein